MKRILTTIQKRANKILLLAVLAGAMASCDSVLDYNEGDCSIKYLVKFKYDMEKVDAFAQEVRTVTLYAFDENGNMVYYKTDQGEMLADGNYSMSLDFDPGEYHLIAWAGLDDQSFAVPVLYPQTSQITELKVKTLREEAVPTRSEDEKDKYIVEKELSSLWHGEVKKSALTRNSRERITEVSLVKNTNNIRIVVAQVNQHPDQPVTRALKKENLKYTIYDENGYMNYDNSLLPDNMLTYKPFATEQEYITSRAFTQDTDSEYPAAIAELSVGRLMKDKKPELNITNTETGEQLIKNLDMIKYLNMLKQEHYKDMELQEYLDREDRYSMIFFVDENLTLIKSVIQINGWVIQLNDFEL